MLLIGLENLLDAMEDIGDGTGGCGDCSF